VLLAVREVLGDPFLQAFRSCHLFPSVLESSYSVILSLYTEGCRDMSVRLVKKLVLWASHQKEMELLED